MMRYDALREPNPKDWLELDEQERIEVARKYHRRIGDVLPNEQIHAIVHAIVENQVAAGDELPTRATIARLMDEGLDRHEAVHAVGTVVVQHMFGALAGSEPVDQKKFIREMKRLTAASWLTEYGEEDSDG